MSTDQELPSAEPETTSKDPSPPVQNEPETGSKPDSDSSKPQVENDTTSKNSALPPNEGVNKPEEDNTASPEIKPAENETSKDSDNTIQAAEISKLEQDDAEKLNKDAKPPSAEDDNTSEISSPPGNDPAQASSPDKQEAGGTKNASQDSEPIVQDIPPEVNASQNTEIRSQETEDAEALKRDSTTSVDPQDPIEFATLSKESSPPEDDGTQSMQTRIQEIDHADVIEDHPHEQDVTRSENEATGAHASSPNNVPMQSVETGTPAKVPKQENVTKDADSHRKKSSSWMKFPSFLFFKKSKESLPKQSGGSTSEISITSSSEDRALSNLISADIKSVEKETKALEYYNERLKDMNRDAESEFYAKERNLSELRKSMIKLKLLIPSQTDVNSDAFKAVQSRLKRRGRIPEHFLDRMPQLHKNDNFYASREFKDFEHLYNNLGRNLRLCLLCFSIFPGNETIRKRLMVRWWVAEGLSSEVEADEYFDKLREEGFIVPVNNNRSLHTGLYRMHPLYQSMLKRLAEKAKFFNFDYQGKTTQNFKNSFQACLVGEGLLSYDDLIKNVMRIDDLEKIHLIMNVEESILDFKPQWFSKMRDVNVMFLGRWQVSDAAHIEVEETKFLDELKNMNSIKFLSLQGISNIIVLTESILVLKRLECLDLRACHNLEKIPSRIGRLARLTQLDMSECFLLDHMPKSLSKLKNLKVLKGFVVKEKNYVKSCTLADLKQMRELNKLCIYTTWRHFPDQTHVSYLEEIENLSKLSIAWGGESKKDDISKHSEGGGDISKANMGPGSSNPLEAGATKLNLDCFSSKGAPICPALAWGEEASKTKIEGGTSSPSGNTTNVGIKTPSKLLSKLKKLELKCFPMKSTPSWLKVAGEGNLEKLYIRGGKFSDLGQYQCIDQSHTSPQLKAVWKVKVLRLKYLSNLEMEWRQLHELFPDLVYLEKIRCPKLTLFNCLADGVWINETRLKAWDKSQTSAPIKLQPQTNQ